jgi:CXXC-20-CXXC protein
MSKCKNCKTTLPFRTIYTSFWKGYKKFYCLNCRTNYGFNSKDRLIGGFVIGISTFSSTLIMNYFELEIVWKISLGFLSIIILCLVLSALSISYFTFDFDKNKLHEKNTIK